MNIFALARLCALGLVARRLSNGPPATPANTHGLAGAVTVVIPARNEAARLSACLESLEFEPVGEVIVVDDGSTDETAQLALDHGARVITAPPLPEGWVGKPWALQAGLLAATNDTVVCLDADVRAKHGLIEALTAQLDDLDVVSFATSPQCSSALDAAVHASLLTTLVYRFGSKPTTPTRLYINGQCIAFRRQWLLREGGFALAGRNLTDDIALARALAARGARIAMLDGSAFATTEMYTDAGETFREWPRSLPMNDCSSRSTRAADTLFLWLVMVVPMLRLLTRRADLIDAATLLARLGTAVGIAKAYKNRGALLAPAVDVACIARLSWTTLQPVKVWRRRSYG